MTILRSIIVLVALLSQAVPVQAMLQGPKAKKCQMSCCASLAAAEMSVCGCANDSVPSEPTQAPQGSSRELVQQVIWSVAHEPGIDLRVASPDQLCLGRFLESASPLQPHVRLSVLFCSFLN